MISSKQEHSVRTIQYRQFTGNAYAKINLFLDVKSILPDGYHEIDGVMQAIDLCDGIKVETFASDSQMNRVVISCSDPGLPTDGRNIAFKAANLFLREVGITGVNVSIHIEKRIPVSGGMAGGSTDAATVLYALNSMLDIPLDTNDLLKLGGAIGADVPFCLAGCAQRTGGIGDKLIPVPSLPPCYILIVPTSPGVSTPDAYRQLDSQYNRFDGESYSAQSDRLEKLITGLKTNDYRTVGQNMYNVFETVILPSHPHVSGNIKELLQNGADYAMMSGSGPTSFGLFTDRESCYRCRETFEKAGKRAFIAAPVRGLPLNVEACHD